MAAKVATYSASEVTELIFQVQKFFTHNPEGKLDVQRHKEGRNEKQQAKLHTLMREIANHVGMQEDVFKQDIIKRDSEGVFKSWPQTEAKGITGDVVMVPKSEKDLTKDEEAHVINMLYVLGGDHGMSWTNAGVLI